MHDILGMLAFFILIGAQFAGVIVVHRWQTENRSTEGRQSGSGLKPLTAAVVKSDGGERYSQRREISRRVRLREASASEPPMGRTVTHPSPEAARY